MAEFMNGYSSEVEQVSGGVVRLERTAVDTPVLLFVECDICFQQGP